jgi:glycosyltransferase involved in cell wall biosynthesis
MKILLVTDAWQPQVNGVVTTLVDLVRQLQVLGHQVIVVQPGQFDTRPCPGYPGVELALFPGRRLRRLMDDALPDAIHIATEGPLGWAARRHCLRRGWPFTTAFLTGVPEMLKASWGVPLAWSYALSRHFHSPSNGVLVATSGIKATLQSRGFRNLREWTHGVDTQQFAFAANPVECSGLGRLARPVSLFVGRLSHEKNVQAFLDLDIPGSKVVCGVGPLEQSLRDRYPGVHWVGVLPRRELAEVYAAADVFVFPSLHETFGRVMLEAMAAGVPVAAYPVNGPLQVVGDSPGGALHRDLHQAWTQALRCQRFHARQRALQFESAQVAELFLQRLAPLPAPESPRRRRQPAIEQSALLTLRSTNLSHKSHRLVE